MPRMPRIIFEGAIYHVYQRGNNKDFIFNNDNHKTFFIKQLKDYNKKFDYQILGYAIMNNHYHLLIKTNKDPINKIMFSINNVMGKFLSRELCRTGHNYEERYQSKLVDNKAYLLWLLRYIHRNPLRAKLCSDLNDYRWCSHFHYRTGFDSFVDTKFILSILSTNKNMAIKQYINFINNSRYEDDLITDIETIKKDFSLVEIGSFINVSPTALGKFVAYHKIAQ